MRRIGICLAVLGVALAGTPCTAEAQEIGDGAVKAQIEEEIEESGLDREDVREIFDFIREKEEDGLLETEEDVRDAVEEAKEEFGLKLTDKEEERIAAAVGRLKKLGLDSEELIGQVEKLYEKYGEDIMEHTDEVIKETAGEVIKSAAGGFFKNIGESVRSFFDHLLK